jgi:hypothetical protein
VPSERASQPETLDRQTSPDATGQAVFPQTLREAEVFSEREVETEGERPESGEASVHETLISSQARPQLHGPYVTGTQPSMPAFAEPPASSRDLRRIWHVDEQFHRQDARIRLLEKEIQSTRRLVFALLGLTALTLAIALGAAL